MELIAEGRDSPGFPSQGYVSQKLNKAPTSWRDFVTWTFSGKNKTIDKNN